MSNIQEAKNTHFPQNKKKSFLSFQEAREKKNAAKMHGNLTFLYAMYSTHFICFLSSSNLHLPRQTQIPM